MAQASFHWKSAVLGAYLTVPLPPALVNSARRPDVRRSEVLLMFIRIAAVVLTLTTAASPAFAKILDGVRQGVRDGDSSSASSKDRDHDDDRERHHDAEHHGRHEHDERNEDHNYGDSSINDDLDEFKAWMALAIVGSPFWIPHLVANDDFQRTQAFAGSPLPPGRWL